MLSKWILLFIIAGKSTGQLDYSPETFQEPSSRQGRSYPQNPMVDLLMQTIAPNYTPKNPGDLFDILRDKYPLPNGLKSPLPEYDYVIVGAGSAGCRLASRLTENPNVNVLLIEVGRPESFITDIPSIAPYFQRTEYSWPYFMEPQPGVCLDSVNVRQYSRPLGIISDGSKHVRVWTMHEANSGVEVSDGMRNGLCYWPRGRAVGGTSVINYMIYTRGRSEEWDRIAADGNYGWSYQDVLKYYKKSERARLNGLEFSPYRNLDGEMDVELVRFRTPLVDAFLAAGRILGSPTIDYNSPEQLGFGYVQATVRGGRRLSAARAFLQDNLGRSNLHILPMTTATKILINRKTNTAYGVQYVRNRLKYKVKARREVILSAGPIASPQLLMLSGIGPRKHLSQHGIPLIKDLPVGQTLYDHITFPGVIFTLNVTGVSFNENRVGTIENAIRYLRYGDNAVATPGGVEAIGYIKTLLSNTNDGVPDIELISIGGSLLSDGGNSGSKAARRGMMMSDKIFNSIFGPKDNTDTWSAFPMLLHPRSVGSLELKDKNPFSHPKMYGNYLTDPIDVATFVAAIRYIQALAGTEPFQRFGAKIYPARYPACPEVEFNSDAYWECAVRTYTATLHHQISTCRMGTKSDPLAVVDPELRVHGINGLRVVDSSVIPRTVSAHTHAPAVMIGEKAADMIKSTWT